MKAGSYLIIPKSFPSTLIWRRSSARIVPFVTGSSYFFPVRLSITVRVFGPAVVASSTAVGGAGLTGFIRLVLSGGAEMPGQCTTNRAAGGSGIPECLVHCFSGRRCSEILIPSRQTSSHRIQGQKYL